jgi:hypothetical protein
MKLFKDILRDKGSSKYSITKFLAVVFSTFLLSYLGYYLFWLKTETDHALVIELLGFIAALLGFKNNWGVKKEVSADGSKTVEADMVIDPKVNDQKEEGVF